MDVNWFECRGDVAEAMRNIYGKLREAEKIPSVKLILLPNLSHLEDELALSVMDRIVRATSGRMLTIPRLPVFYSLCLILLFYLHSCFNRVAMSVPSLWSQSN